MFKKSLIIPMLGMALATGPAWGSVCLTTSNPCTNGVSSGSDSTDRNTFESNAANSDLMFTDVTFNSIVTATNFSTAGLLSNTVVFTGLDGAIADLWGGPIANWSGGGALYIKNNNNGDALTITLPSNVYAFDIDLLIPSGYSGSLPFTVTYNNGATVNANSANNQQLPGSVFFGVTSATQITSITIMPGFGTLGIDNFDFGEDAATPEVGTLLLIGTGLILIRFLHRRRLKDSKNSPEAQAARSWQGERSPMALSL